MKTYLQFLIEHRKETEKQEELFSSLDDTLAMVDEYIAQITNLKPKNI